MHSFILRNFSLSLSYCAGVKLQALGNNCSENVLLETKQAYTCT